MYDYVIADDKFWFGVKIIHSSSVFQWSHEEVNGRLSHPKLVWVVSLTLPKPNCPSLTYSADQSFFPHLITAEHEYECW